APGRYIRHDENGWLAPFGDRERFLAAARTLALDPARRARLGSAARATALTISWDHVVDGLERDLLEVARGPMRPQDAPVA
ncbi:MAG TPA: hypothetical protein VHF69_12235, partial [Candidatus Synoicihabitans sp.]|nr:hypothetical protein [Candidatus Synoicihabitans sp.]